MNKTLFMPLAVAVLAVSSCTDNDYDLSNIDTHVQIPVSNFTVPLKSATVTLDEALDLSSNDKIKKIGDEYAIVQKGEFSSSGVNISNMSVNCPDITISKSNVSTTIDLGSIPAAFDSYKWNDIPAVSRPTGTLVSFDIPDNTNTVNLNSSNVDAHITSVKHLGVNATAQVNVEFPKLKDIVTGFKVEGLTLQLPKGLEVNDAKYNKETGIWNVGDKTIGADLKLSLSLTLTGIDCEKAGAKLENHNFSMSQAVKATGKVVVDASNIKGEATLGAIRAFQTVDYACAVSFGTVTVDKFSGHILYNISVNDQEVNLTDVPSELKEKGTKLQLANPQIYLSVNNPIQQGVTPKVDFSLDPSPANVSAPFICGITIPSVERAKFCMSPTNPSKYYSEGGNYDFTGSAHTTFNNLGNILVCGTSNEEKLPEKIKIKASPVVDQDVENIELKNYDGVTGYWTFYAPLQLTQDAKIHYEKEDLTANNDFENMTVTSAVLEAESNSEVPLDLKLTVTVVGDGSMSNTVDLPSGQSKLNVKLDGNKVKNIKGYKVVADVKGKDKTLSPNQKIVLKNIKLTVNGYYEEEL